ncbi:c-type cytochrome biogenesis protein CcmI [Marimonas sp. MJW-29]|uniref:C-type cytochrome biogenesis protein CcmI n=1 Tax=Sulfitobacter sediminis TaxID=3234186 RepID=A0ABV3RS74_9RHOB
MTFWIIILAISAFVVLILARGLLGKGDRSGLDLADYDLQVYRDQLAEVDRDVARGVIGAEDAERARTEISRRILAADANRGSAVGKAPVAPKLVIALIGVALIGGSMALYTWIGQPGYGDLALEDRIAFAEEMRENRPGQQVAVDSLPPFVQQQEVSEEFATLMERLRETVAGRPDDLQGHRLLAQNEARIGNFVAAAQAQETVLRIRGSDISAEDIADYGEFLVLAAGGYVSPEAEKAFRAALAKDETDGRARYYIGLMMIQTGRPDIAFRLWDGLLRRGPEDAPWIEPILSQIETVAQLAGVNYTLPAIGSASAPGPSAGDIAAAAEMTPEERMDMIGSMVEGLSNRLATEGGPPRDWARLITSLGVLGEREQAFAVFNNAMEVFADDASAIDTIRAAGQQAGVAE